jgi:hypothetical protein
MAPWKKHAQKSQKVSNTIEKQMIVIYVALIFQGMSWKVHSNFAYAHIKTHPYFPCESEKKVFLVNFLYSNTWTIQIKFLSQNKILPWFFIHNIFLLFI